MRATSTLDVVGGSAGQVICGSAEVPYPGLSRDRYVMEYVERAPGLGALRLVRLTPQEAAKRKRSRRALRVSASSYARENVGLRGEVVIRPAPQGPGQEGTERPDPGVPGLALDALRADLARQQVASESAWWQPARPWPASGPGATP